MIKRILIPLDGSKLAEQALAPAQILVRKMHAIPILLHVIEKNSPTEVHGQRHLHSISQANTYLENLVKKNPFLKRASVEIHVHEDGSLPVLLSNARPDSEDVCSFDHVLLAQDGDPEHNVGEKIATDFANQLKSTLLLLTVVPTFGTLPPDQSPAILLLPSATGAMLDISEESSAEYLKSQIRKLQKTGLKVHGEVERGDPAECILEVAAEKGMDLIVLATHGKAGLEAFFAGSVASKIITEATIPLLLIPV